MIISKLDFDKLTIALIPALKIMNEATRLNRELEKKLTGIPNKKNIIHISLFQGQFRSSHLKKIGEELAEISMHTSSLVLKFAPVLTNASTNLFWNVQSNFQLHKLHKKILASISPYREGVLPVFVDGYSHLSLVQQQLLECYGTPHALQNFNPHMTVYYGVGHSDLEQVKVIKPQQQYLSGVSDKLVVGRIGYAGNLEEIFEQFQLKERNHIL
jgi:2'-5' RNA ligase